MQCATYYCKTNVQRDLTAAGAFVARSDMGIGRRTGMGGPRGDAHAWVLLTFLGDPTRLCSLGEKGLHMVLCVMMEGKRINSDKQRHIHCLSKCKQPK